MIKKQFGSVTEDDFEQAFLQISEVQISSLKELKDNLNSITNKLHSDDWQQRVDNLRLFRSIIKCNPFPIDELLQYIKPFDIQLKTCISDLRSQVVREACITVAFLSKEIKNKLEYFLEQLLESLLNLVSNGVKIMSSSGKVALKYVVNNSHSSRLVPYFITSMTTSKSTSLRQFSCELVKIVCESWNVKILEKNSPAIAEALKKGINDADEQARAHSREAFCWFETKFPILAEKLLQSLDPIKQKSLKKDFDSFKKDNTDCSGDLKTPLATIVAKTVAKATLKPVNSVSVSRSSSVKSDKQTTISKIAVPKMDANDNRGRIQKVSQSQPSTREPSPTSKNSYITFSNGASEYKYLNKFQKKTFPNAYSSLRQKDTLETQMADSLKKQPRRNNHDQYQSDENTSETSSVISDMLPSFNDIIVLLNNKSLNERKKGLLKAKKYIMEASMKPTERKTMIDIFNAMFMESQTVVIKRFLTVLYAFIDRYHDHITDWLYVLIIKSLNLQANERVKSCKTDVQRILNLLIEYYGANAIFVLCCKYIIDKTNEPTIKVRLCMLEYVKVILSFAQPNLLDTVNPDLGPTLGNILLWTAETKSADLRKVSSNVVIKLFDLNSAQFTRLLNLLPNTFQDRATVILNAYISSNSVSQKDSSEASSEVGGNRKSAKPSTKSSNFNRSNSLHYKTPKAHNNTQKQSICYKTNSNNNSTTYSSSFPKRSPKTKIDLGKTSDFIKINTEALQNLSLNYDNLDKMSGFFSNSSSNKSTTNNSNSPSGSYQKSNNNQAKLCPVQTPKQNLNNNDNNNNNLYDNKTSNVPKLLLSSQNSHPELSMDNGDSNISSSNESNVGNKYTPDLYSSGPIDTSTKNSHSMSGELAPEDMMTEILMELSNHNDRHEERKACLFRLIKVFRENTPTDWDEHFKTLLFLLLETMGDNEPEIRVQSLRVLQELARSQPSRFVDFTQLTILRILEAHKDPEKSVIKAAEECSRVLTSTLALKACLKMLIDVISDSSENQLCLPGMKMLIKLIKNSERSSIESDIHNLCEALSIVVNHKESQVRKESVLCMVEMHKVVGDEIWSLLKLNNSQARLLDVYIKKGSG